MANNNNPTAAGFGGGDDFLEQILAIPSYAGDVQLTSSSVPPSSGLQQPLFPLGLSLDNGRDDLQEREAVNLGALYSGFEQLQQHAVRHPVQQVPQPVHGQPTPTTAVSMPHPPNIRPRVRARRGQATDPHSIAERLRRERISERIKALQELVPSCNKVCILCSGNQSSS
ncbi:hypothetical protein Leryth_014003 [Lithospermum erythrorhizon]|nr:hypothetical protein Leryth_014003 [Lithospermum erythrorhizon]